MSLTDAQITGASTPLFLDEDEYLASPLSDLDFAEFDEWVQSRFIRIARDSAPKGQTPEEITERNEITQAAMLTASAITFLTQEGQQILNSRIGMAKLIWFMIHKNHPDITVEKILPYLRNRVNIENASLIFQKQNSSYFGMQDSNGQPGGPAGNPLSGEKNPA